MPIQSARSWVTGSVIVLAAISGSCTNLITPPASDVPWRSFSDAPMDGVKFSQLNLLVKFRQNSAVRLRNGTWQADLASLPPDVVASYTAGIMAANAAVALVPGAVIDRQFKEIDETVLDQSRQRLMRVTAGEAPPDLNLHYVVRLPVANAAALHTLLLALERNPVIEAVYPEPIPRGSDIPPTTIIDLRSSQGYTERAPKGIDVPFARKFAGGRGEGSQIVDVELGWVLSHEDLPDGVFTLGINFGGQYGLADAGNHGTAVAGVLWGVENNIGVTGIVPLGGKGVSGVGTITPFGYSPAGAITRATISSKPGDIILIEQHMPDFTTGIACLSPCSDTCGYFPVEFYPAEFDAIKFASDAGIVVVEAAGNGELDLNAYPEFDLRKRNSGAIMVGASNGGGDRRPACFTNSGTRVDVHAWGGGVATLGYGDTTPDLRANGDDQRQWYTRVFAGTSSASAIVAGAASLMQSVRAGQRLPPLSPRALRNLFVATGTPQDVGVQIGPQPDLRAALRSTMPFLPDQAMFVSEEPGFNRAAQGSSFDTVVSFRNTGTRDWKGDHWVAALPNDSTWGSAHKIIGATDAVEPDKIAMSDLQLTAPPTPGSYSFSVGLFADNGSAPPILVATSPVRNIVVASSSTPFDNATLTLVSFPGAMASGASGNVVITAQNAGTTTWRAGRYLLFLSRQRVVGLPNQSVALAGDVAPGAKVTLTFAVSCTGSGTGGFSAQMRSPVGTFFGDARGGTIVCQ